MDNAQRMVQAMRGMELESWEIERVNPYPGNPRINDQAVDAVADSIQAFGFKVPILVDREGVIIAGHTRLKAARKLGMSHVPVIRATDLDEDAVRALRIADNKTSEASAWDEDLLREELASLEGSWVFTAMGFTEAELDQLLARADAAMGDADADAVPDAPENADSQPGLVYELDQHRLLCGDATRMEQIRLLMDDGQADLLLTDPPYNVGYVGKTKDALTIDNDTMGDEAYRAFLASAFRAADAVMRPGAPFYVWHADSEGFNNRAAARDAGWTVRQCLVWNKNRMVLGRQDYHWRHEPCLYGWKDGAAHAWYGDRTQTTVLEFDRPDRSDVHPTMKPVALFSYLLENSTAPGNLVLDPFGGSGTTLIAAQLRGRQARLAELDPRYCDVIRRRWATLVHGEGCDWQARTPVLAA